MSPEEKFAGMDLKFINPAELETVEEAAYVMAALSGIIDSIEDQIGRAKSEVYKGGRYCDPLWFRDAERAVRGTRRTRALVQDRRGVLARQEKQKTHMLREMAFVEAARILLDNDTYLAIWDLAKEDLRCASTSCEVPQK